MSLIGRHIHYSFFHVVYFSASDSVNAFETIVHDWL